MSGSTNHKVPIKENYPRDADNVQFRTEVLFLLMQEYYQRGNVDLNLTEREEFFKKVTRLQVGWELWKTMIDKNIELPKCDREMEREQVLHVEGLFEKLEDCESNLSRDGFSYELLRPFWETLWDIYDLLFPGSRGTWSKRR